MSRHRKLRLVISVILAEPVFLIFAMMPFIEEVASRETLTSGFFFPGMMVGLLLIFAGTLLRFSSYLRGIPGLGVAGGASSDPLGRYGLAFSWLFTALYLIAACTFMYWMLGVRDNAAFTEPLSQVDSLYFALTTFTTTGFGDIAPLSEAARLAVSGQMILGFALVVVGLSLALSHRRRDASRPPTSAPESGVPGQVPEPLAAAAEPETPSSG